MYQKIEKQKVTKVKNRISLPIGTEENTETNIDIGFSPPQQSEAMGSRTNSARGKSMNEGVRKPQLGSDVDNPELSKSHTKKHKNRASINLGKTANRHSKVVSTSPD
jgi:actin-like ATPase involved in cell morphogenesis